MADIVKLLPDNIANQIAAGEVIQRPASAIKELLENAIDAGATKIDVIVKDAGRTLMQVIDNGCGMSVTDARMSFERHATSKIRTSGDLFNITTKGFRGEALASIAAVAQVELRTKTHEDELGTSIKIEGSKVVSQEPVQAATGTNFQIKNLFFNVPARRNFLKSNPVETKHIIDEIERVALPHPDIHFTFNHNGNEVFNLPSGSLRQRIIGIFGKKYNERLVPIEEDTSILNLTGYIVKPEFCKRTRGEQFFFVNNRFIKNGYLHHAVNNSYKELLAKEQFPSYFIFMKVDPSKIDINIHPTKTEVKFEDEKSMYAIINSAVKNSLGKFNITPTLDFEREESFEVPALPKDKAIFEPTVKVDPTYNPFRSSDAPTTSSKPSKSVGSNYRIEISQSEIEANLELLASADPDQEVEENDSEETTIEAINYTPHKIFQVHQKYILTQVGSSLLMIDQHRAHRQILFEELSQSNNQQYPSQKLLFPRTMELGNADYTLLLELMPEINKMGFELSDMGGKTIGIHGIPAGSEENNCESIIEEFVEQCKNSADAIKENQLAAIAWNMAKGLAIQKGKKLSVEEMGHLVDQLFSCELQSIDAHGHKIIVSMSEDELQQKFA